MLRDLVVGLDIAGNTGVAWGFVGNSIPSISSVRFRLESDGYEDAYGRAIKWAARFILEMQPAAVYVEGVVPENKIFSNHDSAMVRIGLYGAITGVFRAKGIPVFPVSIAKVRTNFLGRGHRMKGKEAKAAVMKRCQVLGWNAPDLDASDAAAVWSFGSGDWRIQKVGLAG